MTRCSVRECKRESVARGLCDLHYRRLLHHGDVEKGRPLDWGRRENHTLYNSWQWIRRGRTISVDKSWRKDFWQFVKDVGDKPSERHTLDRLDATKPIGPTNFYWREKLVFKLSGESRKQYLARFQRAYRKLHPERTQEVNLRKTHGISVAEYTAILETQNGLCAICGKQETSYVRRHKIIRRLAVDHCHDTGKIRGLLCTTCNQGIGSFNDDPRLLRKAAQYLEQK